MATKQFTQEELDHFINHPEEVDATDTDLVMALAGAETMRGAGDTGHEAEQVVNDPDAEAAAKASAEAKAKIEAEEARLKAEEEAAAKAKAATEAAGKGGEGQDGATKILAPDGKSTLPYSVLKSARAEAGDAKAALLEASQTIVSLQERLKALEGGKADPGKGEQEATVDELEQILGTVEEEAPWLKEPMRKLIDTVKAQSARIAEFDQEREETETEARQRLQRTAAEAFENNPTLVLWKEESPDLYEEAVAMDETLRRNPQMAGRFRSFDDRYAHVVKLVKASHEGEDIPLPKAVSTPAAKDPPATKPSAAEVKARAEKALAEAEDTTVRTLSDIPGGEGERTAVEQLERMDPSEIASKLAHLSPHEIASWVTSGSRL